MILAAAAIALAAVSVRADERPHEVREVREVRNLREVRGTFVRLSEEVFGEKQHLALVVKPADRDGQVTILVPKNADLAVLARRLKPGEKVEIGVVTDGGRTWVKRIEAEGLRRRRDGDRRPDAERRERRPDRERRERAERDRPDRERREGERRDRPRPRGEFGELAALLRDLRVEVQKMRNDIRDLRRWHRDAALRAKHVVEPWRALPDDADLFYYCTQCMNWLHPTVDPLAVKSAANVYALGQRESLYDPDTGELYCGRQNTGVAVRRLIDADLYHSSEPMDASAARAIRRHKRAARCSTTPLRSVHMIGRCQRLGKELWALCELCGALTQWEGAKLGRHGFTCEQHGRRGGGDAAAAAAAAAGRSRKRAAGGAVAAVYSERDA
ncbi:hypothetical protein LCGC14_2670240, partial [marine sediment metagenome]